MASRKAPKIFVIAESITNQDNLQSMLEEIGMDSESAENWRTKDIDNVHISCSQQLIEVAGRLCYKSFVPGMNKNVTKVREGNDTYLKNILESKHGSVLEHATVSIAFINVTRVFTHEIVRNRAGNAFSQESLRYVALDDLGFRWPKLFDDDNFWTDLWIGGAKKGKDDYDRWKEGAFGLLMIEFVNAFREAEERIKRMSGLLNMGNVMNFDLKKKVTSAFRRVVPDGLTTNIIVTGNHRAWRYMIEQRTSEHAEEEIQEVISMVAQVLKEGFPNIYQDMINKSGHVWGFENSKV